MFRSVAVHDPDGGWYWEERPERRLRGTSRGVRLRSRSRAMTPVLQEFIGSQRTVPLDRDKPLWRMFCIDGYQGGSAVLVADPPCHRRWHPHGAAGDEPLRRHAGGRGDPGPAGAAAARSPGDAATGRGGTRWQTSPAAVADGAGRAHRRRRHPHRRCRRRSGLGDDGGARARSASVVSVHAVGTSVDASPDDRRRHQSRSARSTARPP